MPYVPVSLDCQVLVAPSVYSYVYLFGTGYGPHGAYHKAAQYVHGNRKEMSCWLRWYYFPWIMVGAKVWECHAPCTLAFYEKEDALYQIHKTQSLTFHHLIRGWNCLPFASSWFHTQFLVSVAHLFSLLCFLFCLSSFCILHLYVRNVGSFSGLFILDCPFGFL